MQRAVFIEQMIKCEPTLLKYAFKLTKNVQISKDLVQEVYLKALLGIDKHYKDIDKMQSWLFHIMYTTFINNYRRRKLIQSILIITDDLYYINPIDPLPTADSIISEKYLRSKIEAIPNSKNSQAFKLHIDGFSYGEIAEIQQVPMGTVKSRIFKFRQELIKKLKEE